MPLSLIFLIGLFAYGGELGGSSVVYANCTDVVGVYATRKASGEQRPLRGEGFKWLEPLCRHANMRDSNHVLSSL